eukprot:scaffold503_cov365-Prasinococcus_capsulatus_cf.AAC.4
MHDVRIAHHVKHSAHSNANTDARRSPRRDLSTRKAHADERGLLGVGGGGRRGWYVLHQELAQVMLIQGNSVGTLCQLSDGLADVHFSCHPHRTAPDAQSLARPGALVDVAGVRCGQRGKQYQHLAVSIRWNTRKRLPGCIQTVLQGGVPSGP